VIDLTNKEQTSRQWSPQGTSQLAVLPTCDQPGFSPKPRVAALERQMSEEISKNRFLGRGRSIILPASISRWTRPTSASMTEKARSGLVFVDG
jgi:hypothetical protein